MKKMLNLYCAASGQGAYLQKSSLVFSANCFEGTKEMMG